MANIRDYLSHFIGLRLVDITQHDIDDIDRAAIADGLSGGAFVCLMFENGFTIKFPITEEPLEYSE